MEILIWGDNMKRQISISIFFAIFLILLVWLYIKFYNENKVNENELSTEVKIVKEEDAITISEDYHLYEFYIKDENGKLVVYQTKNQEFYMETGISTYTLPLVIRERIMSGIFFETEAELYDFLESYSS